MPNNGMYGFPTSGVESPTFGANVGVLYNITPPPSSGWTWQNKGNLVDDYANNSVYIYGNNTGGLNIRTLERPYPTPPFTLKIGFFILSLDTADDSEYGLAVRDASNGKIVTIGFSPRTSGFGGMGYFNNWQSWSGGVGGVTTLAKHFGPYWIGFNDDGVNFNAMYSIDNYHWHTKGTASRTACLTTPGYIGVCFNNKASNPAYLNVFHWQMT